MINLCIYFYNYLHYFNKYYFEKYKTLSSFISSLVSKRPIKWKCLWLYLLDMVEQTKIWFCLITMYCSGNLTKYIYLVSWSKIFVPLYLNKNCVLLDMYPLLKNCRASIKSQSVKKNIYIYININFGSFVPLASESSECQVTIDTNFTKLLWTLKKWCLENKGL